jgi:hypothetical protein
MGARLLAACLLAAARSAFAAPPAPSVSLEPPPGWSDVTGKTRVRGVLLALRGPESSAFVVAEMPASALDSAAATRAYLGRALDQLRAGAKLDYRSNGRVETQSLRNGVTLRFLRAELDGRPRLIVAAFDGGGPPLLGTLSSAAPDAMLAPLFGALKMGAAAGAVRESGAAVSLDGQMQIALGGGLRSRDLTPDEKRQGAVLSIQGSGSEVLFMKVEDEDASPKDQAAIVRAVVADAAKVPLDSVSPALKAGVPSGPSAAYAWAKLPGSADLRFAAGFLPWAYWGYSIMARGPQADELLVGTLAALKLGPSAVPKLVAASPPLDIPEDSVHRRAAAAAAAAGVLIAASIIWSRRRKNANLPQ